MTTNILYFKKKKKNNSGDERTETGITTKSSMFFLLCTIIFSVYVELPGDLVSLYNPTMFELCVGLSSVFLVL